MHRVTANYGEAEPLIRQARSEVKKACLGEQPTAYAGTLDHLAVMYVEMGNYAAAGPLVREVLEIRRTAMGENHPDFARSLNTLAGFYRGTGNYGEASQLLHQAPSGRSGHRPEKSSTPHHKPE